MAIPKKRSRKIEFQGENYVWLLRTTEHELILAIEHDFGGQLLRVELSKLNLFRRLEDDGSFEQNLPWRFVRQGRQVTPELVRKLMYASLNQGWKPRAKIF